MSMQLMYKKAYIKVENSLYIFPRIFYKKNYRKHPQSLPNALKKQLDFGCCLCMANAIWLP